MKGGRGWLCMFVCMCEWGALVMFHSHENCCTGTYTFHMQTLFFPLAVLMFLVSPCHISSPSTSLSPSFETPLLVVDDQLFG